MKIYKYAPNTMSVHYWKECFGNIQSSEKSFSHGLLPNLDAAKDIKKVFLMILMTKLFLNSLNHFLDKGQHIHIHAKSQKSYLTLCTRTPH